jgi:hypothetical protein
MVVVQKSTGTTPKALTLSWVNFVQVRPWVDKLVLSLCIPPDGGSRGKLLDKELGWLMIRSRECHSRRFLARLSPMKAPTETSKR